MSERLFDALETCLQALEQGETIDAALARFPALAADLRPILEASLHARTLGGSPLPEGIQRRGRARLLQRAAEMREAKHAPRRSWLVQFRPLAVALMLVIFFLSGTGLVRASTTSLPGDNLYPVKRTWEDVRLIFAFNPQERETIELEYETERLHEINELLVEGRAEPISFSGYVTAQTDSQWTVSGIPVAISAQTVLSGEPVTIGTAVTVYGITTLAGSVEAHSINTVPAGTPIPTPKPEDENEPDDDDDDEGGESRQKPEPRESSDNEANDSGEDSESGEKSKVEGIIQSINGDIWIVDGQTVNVSGAEIVGTPAPGATVTIEGYVDANGVFVATNVVLGDSGGNGSDDNSDSLDGDSNDDKNDDSDNGDDSDNNNDSNNGDDSDNNDDSNNDSDFGGDDLPDNDD